MYNFTPALLLYFLFFSAFSVAAHGIDSIRTTITPVQCYGLRNGELRVDSVFGGLGPYYFSLDEQSFTTNPTFDRLWAGKYTLYVRDGSGNTWHWPFVVQEPPELLVKLAASDSSVVAGEPFDLRALISLEPEFVARIEWSPAALFARQDTARQNLHISENTEFTVVVQDQKGCSANATLQVEVEQAKLYFPNVIQPGSPSDAYFTVFAGEGVRRVVSLQVYSRAGGMVFERRDFPPNAPLLGWGGRWNGQSAQSGVYPWLAEIELLDGKHLHYEGTVTVLR